MTKQYHTCCVNSTAELIHKMVDNAQFVTFATFRRNCAGVDEWAKQAGYSVGPEKGLHLGADFAVSFHKSRYAGRLCYYIRHSAIEYIWL